MSKSNKLGRTHLFNTALKVVKYGQERWLPTKEGKYVGREEPRTLGVSLSYDINNQTLRQMSCVTDIVVATEEVKIRWAEHITRLADSQWTSHVTEWYLRKKRPLG